MESKDGEVNQLVETPSAKMAKCSGERERLGSVPGAPIPIAMVVRVVEGGNKEL
jgi:hypothetical protein